MARQRRMERAGAWHHVTARGNERRPIFRTNVDRLHFLGLLAELPNRFDLLIHAYVLMDNHYHLLLETRRANLGRACQWLNVSYSVWFNRKHRRSGHLFQGRFKSILVEPLQWGLALSRYLHLNPVRVARLGLSKQSQRGRKIGAGSPNPGQTELRLRELEEFPWSSYRAYIGRAPAPAWLCRDSVLALGGGRRALAADNYRAYVESVIKDEIIESPWAQVRAQALGNPIAGAAESAAERVALSWDKIVQAAERVGGGKWEELCQRHGDRSRNRALWLARKEGGFATAELVKGAGLGSGASLTMCLKRYEAVLNKSPEEQQKLKQMKHLLNVKS
ncbi:MAG TPA: transposase [Methylomirabilota bacterium]|nr:transposase [Methylomirabilota bacterium]